jgi:hypothetical protein
MVEGCAVGPDHSGVCPGALVLRAVPGGAAATTMAGRFLLLTDAAIVSDISGLPRDLSTYQSYYLIVRNGTNSSHRSKLARRSNLARNLLVAADLHEPTHLRRGSIR